MRVEVAEEEFRALLGSIVEDRMAAVRGRGSRKRRLCSKMFAPEQPDPSMQPVSQEAPEARKRGRVTAIVGAGLGRKLMARPSAAEYEETEVVDLAVVRAILRDHPGVHYKQMAILYRQRCKAKVTSADAKPCERCPTLFFKKTAMLSWRVLLV